MARVGGVRLEHGSWDPIGLRQPEFADPEIMAAIEKHNGPCRTISISRTQ